MADVGQRQRLFCQVIHPKPHSMHVAHMSLAAGRKRKEATLAVTIHDDASSNFASPSVSHGPALYKGNAVALLDGLGQLSSETLISSLHSWEPVLQL